jgi:undecaprenyl-diphosphatase
MKLLLRLLSAYGLAVLAAAGFGLVALLVGRGRIASFDSSLISWIQGWENAGLTSVMKGLSWFGTTLPTTIFSILIALFLYFVLRHRWEVILFIVVMAGSTLLNHILKAAFRRERPDLHRLAEEASYAFPSGHAMASFALYGIVAYLLWRHIGSFAGRIILIAVCAAMFLGIGISRIYLGVHYPSDVIGGYLASGLWLALSIAVFGRWAGKNKSVHYRMQGERP